MRFGVPRVFIASPPCQEPSLRNMPWGRLAMKRGKLGPPLKFIELFEACFRIRLEASVAAGSVIPLVIENVRGAQDWIGRAKGRYGSYHLWGDVPDKLPPTDRVKQHGSGAAWWDEALDKRRRDATALKTVGHLNKRDGHSHTRHLTNQREHVKVPGIKLSEVGFNVAAARRIEESHKLDGSRISAEERKRMRTQHIGTSRKAASALIAKIPFPLAQHIARCFKPEAA